MNIKCDVCKAQMGKDKKYHRIYTQWTPFPRRGSRHFCRPCYNKHFKGKTGYEMAEIFRGLMK